MQTTNARNSKRNVTATARSGLRTGARSPAVAPVTVWVGAGPTSMPATLPEPTRHPAPSTTNPTEIKCQRAVTKIVPTRSRTRPYAIVIAGKRFSEHRSHAAAELALRTYEATQTLLRG